jgi:serine/threonine protein kinase
MAALTDKVLDHFHLRESIGKGGMATVYRAVDTRTIQNVAVKVLSPRMGTERQFLKRFRREASLVKRVLEHPNIVRVLEYGETQGFIYIVMPLIKGETMTTRLARGPVGDEEVGRWIAQVTDALAFAHERGIIHRDIKPSNVIITESGDAMLTDFGLAREIDGSSTLTGSMLMGTPAYISPEQAKGDRLDERSDQYSLGVILYLLATGRLPFDAGSAMGTVMAHLREAVPRPSRFNRELSPDVEKVILKSLAKDRDNRFKSVTELNEAYQAALDGEVLPYFDLPPETLVPGRERRFTIPTRPHSPFPEEYPRQGGLSRWLLITALVVIVLGGGLLLFGPSLLDLTGLGLPSGNAAVETMTPEPESTPVSTQAPPTITPVPTPFPPITSDVCPGFLLHSPNDTGNDVEWLLDNSTTGPVSVIRVQNISWDFGAKGKLEQIWLGDDLIWEGELFIDNLDQLLEWDMRHGADPTLGPGSARQLKLHFQWANPPVQPYQLGIVLDAGCTLAGEW